MNLLYQLSDFIFSGYTLTAILLLLTYFFIKTKRPLISRLMVWSNWILITGSCLYLIATLIYIFTLLNAGDEAANKLNRLIGPYWFGFWGLVFFKGILPQLLWLKKIRIKMRMTLVLLPFIQFDYYYSTLINWQLNLYRDYLPGSPLYQHGNYLPSSRIWYGPDYSEILLITLIYTSVLVAFYIFDRKGKLPE